MAERRSGGTSRNNFTEEKSSADTPPMSRLFIICSKSVTEENLREHFDKFGDIEEIWIVKDRATGEGKGITEQLEKEEEEGARRDRCVSIRVCMCMCVCACKGKVRGCISFFTKVANASPTAKKGTSYDDYGTCFGCYRLLNFSLSLLQPPRSRPHPRAFCLSLRLLNRVCLWFFLLLLFSKVSPTSSTRKRPTRPERSRR